MGLDQQNSWSRRRFITSLSTGAAAVAVSDASVVARALLSSPDARLVDGVRRMGGNENPVGPSPMAVKAVAEQLEGLNWYPHQPDLELAIYRFHGIPVETNDGIGWAGLNTTSIQNSRVVTGVGSTEILRAAAWAYLLEGGHVVQATPSYEEIAGAGAKLGDRVSTTRVPVNGNHGVDLDAMAAAITSDTRLVSLCNPNNPTGGLLGTDELIAFVDGVKPDILIVIDEAYIHYVRDPSYRNAIQVALSRSNVLVTRTFSKGYGIAGLRVGYGVADPDVIRKIRNYTLGPLGMHSNSIAGAVAALDDTGHLEETRRVNLLGRDYLSSEMMSVGWSPLDGEGNFVTVDTGKDSQEVFEFLLARGILITPGSRWDMPTFIRVSVGMPEDNEAFVSAVREM